MRPRERKRLCDKARYNRRKQNGLCVQCGERAVPGLTLCPNCQLKHSLAQKKCNQAHSEQRRIKAWGYRERRKAEDRCIRCGAPLIEGERAYCFNCLIFRHSGMIKGVLREVNYETATIKS